MSWQQSGPLRSGNRETALNPFDSDQSYRSGYQPQPHCELYGINLVDEFPPRCIYRTSNPLITIFELREASFLELGRHYTDADVSGALELLDQMDTCSVCIDVNLTHRTVRRLRREMGVSA